VHFLHLKNVLHAHFCYNVDVFNFFLNVFKFVCFLYKRWHCKWRIVVFVFLAGWLSRFFCTLFRLLWKDAFVFILISGSHWYRVLPANNLKLSSSILGVIYLRRSDLQFGPYLCFWSTLSLASNISHRDPQIKLNDETDRAISHVKMEDVQSPRTLHWTQSPWNCQ